MANNPHAADNLKPFVKGDPRINRKGRPKNFDALRILAQEVLNGKVMTSDGSVAMSRVQIILTDWAQSRDVRKQQALVEIAYGKTPQSLEVSGKDGVPLIIGIGGLDPKDI